MQSPQAVSVVICVYTEERWEDLTAAIRSVQQQSLAPLEVVVVVDHNSALLRRIQAEVPGVVTVENGEKQGLAGARNSGIAAARGDLIAFLDDDAVAEPDWLARLAAHCADPKVLGAGGWVEPRWIGPRPTWFPEEFHWVVGCSYVGLPETTAQVRNPFGGCSCIRREVFETVGGFRNEVGRVGARLLGCEETELSIRARQHWPDRVFIYDPQARIHHKVPAQRVRLEYFRARCYGEGISKARVSELVGAGDGLSAERSYTAQVLPRGVARGLRDWASRRDSAGLARAGAIVAGLAFTAAGYTVGLVSRRLEGVRS